MHLLPIPDAAGTDLWAECIVRKLSGTAIRSAATDDSNLYIAQRRYTACSGSALGKPSASSAILWTIRCLPDRADGSAIHDDSFSRSTSGDSIRSRLCNNTHGRLYVLLSPVVARRAMSTLRLALVELYLVVLCQD